MGIRNWELVIRNWEFVYWSDICIIKVMIKKLAQKMSPKKFNEKRPIKNSPDSY